MISDHINFERYLKYKDFINHSIKRPLHDQTKVDNFFLWLEEETDFFTAPASSRYHLAIPGGLLTHSLNVVGRLLKFENYVTVDAVLSGLFHDICKINTYEKTETGYKKRELLPYGHGEKSVMILRDFLYLSDNAMAAIRYHMGAFFNDDKDVVMKVFKEYPLARNLHIADLMSTCEEDR